jgi:WD40 repeat protein
MLEDLTQIGQIKRRLQNHSVAALILFGGAAVIGLGLVAGAFKSLHGLLQRPPTTAGTARTGRKPGSQDIRRTEGSREATLSPKATVFQASASVKSVAFSVDGRRLAYNEGGTISIVDLATGQLQLSFRGEVDKEYPLVRAMSFSPDGQWLAVGGNDGNVKLFEATSGRLAKSMRGHVDWVTAVAFSRDGRLVSGSDDQTVRIWSTKTATAIRMLKGHRGFVTGVAFSPDGSRVSSTSSEGTVKVWEANTGALIWSVDGHPKPANAVAFSPDGRAVASASDDDTIKLWDADNGTLLRTLSGHPTGVGTSRPKRNPPVDHLAFAPGGEWLASTGGNAVALWNANSGVLVQTLIGHTQFIHCLAVSPDGHWLASGDQSNVIRLWFR